MFSIRNIIILGIVVFPSLLILILANIIDSSFAVDIQSTLTNNSEFENKVIKSDNPLKDDDICLRYENITKTIVVCNGTVDILTINDFFNNNSDILEMTG